MPISKEQVQRIREALLEAVQEANEHNSDYHHITPQSVIERWNGVIRELPQ